VLLDHEAITAFKDGMIPSDRKNSWFLVGFIHDPYNDDEQQKKKTTHDQYPT